jgi:hypothetical protein
VARKRSSPKVPVGGIVREPSVRVMHENRGEEAVRPIRGLQRSILDTPPPWRKDWLDAHGLEVRYRHGRAELRRKA